MWVLVVLLVMHLALVTALSLLNVAHLRRTAAGPSPEWTERLDLSRFPAMVAYTAANTHLSIASGLSNLAITLLIVASGLLPAVAQWTLTLGAGPATPFAWLTSMVSLS